jgi:hypothetical protein
VSSGGWLARVDMANDHNVNVTLLFTHNEISALNWNSESKIIAWDQNHTRKAKLYLTLMSLQEEVSIEKSKSTSLPIGQQVKPKRKITA